MNTALRTRLVASALLAASSLSFAGCATTSADAAPAETAGRIVETKSVLITGSHIPVKVPKNPIAHPEPTLAPVVSLSVSDTAPFQGPGAAPAGPVTGALTCRRPDTGPFPIRP